MSEIKESVIHKEIDLIQACITRMANNSFLLKGGTVSLVSVVLAFIPENVDTFLTVGILFMIITCSWYLDSFFLHVEKMYRKMYEWVIKERPKGNILKLYDLNPHRFKGDVGSMFKTMISPTLRVFYGIPLILVVITAIFNL